jgi:hypothetical protein
LQVCLGILDGHVHAFSRDVVESGQQAPAAMFQHSLLNIIRFSLTYNNQSTFMYLLRDSAQPLLYCYLYQAASSSDVSISCTCRTFPYLLSTCTRLLQVLGQWW